MNKVLGPKLIESGIDVKDQASVDQLLNKLDGTQNKTSLGANAILGGNFHYRLFFITEFDC